MAQKDLIPLNKRSKAEQKRIQSMGGKASGAARRRRKTMREALELIASDKAPESVIKKLKRKGFDPETNDDAMAIAMVIEATKGNTAAFGAIARVRGEDTQNIEVGEAETKFAEVLDTWKTKRDDVE